MNKKGKLNGFPRIIKCLDCGIEFLAINPIHKRCGDRDLKIGCAYKARLKWLREVKYPKDKETLKYKEYHLKYDREWKRLARLDPIYKKKSYEWQRKWQISEQGRKWVKDHYQEYLPDKLRRNRQRRLIQKGVFGSHTNMEWNELKKKYNYCCAECGISEKELRIIWEGTIFDKLTKDHIIPISKRGTDFIENLKPLCISCNSKKYNHIVLNGIVGITFGAMDFLHAGHCMMLKEISTKCDYLIVGLQTDPSLDREDKNKPIMTIEERLIMLRSNRYVDNIVVYERETDLVQILKQINPDVRFLGEDHKGEPFTGEDLPIKIIFNSRNHPYSSSNLIERVKKQ